MNKTLCLLLLAFVFAAVGCKTTGGTKSQWGETYADVIVPADYVAYDSPPFKRTDGADGKRIYGRYAYRCSNGLDKAGDLAVWFKKELPKQGWEHQLDEVDADKGTMTLRYKKKDDQLVLKLAPDNLVNKSERFSVLTIEMNPPYDN